MGGFQDHIGWDVLRCGAAHLVSKVNDFIYTNYFPKPTHASSSAPTSSPFPVSLPILDTAIVDSGSSGVYLAKGAPCTNINLSAPTISVGTTTGHIQQSSVLCTLVLPHIPWASTNGHIFPSFQHSHISVSNLFDADCTLVFTKSSVVVRDPRGEAILTGWREATGPKLWRFSLRPKCPPVDFPGATTTSIQAFSTYGLSSVEALVRYLYAAAVFLVRSTWLAVIKAGNYSSWPGLTYANANAFKISSDFDETLKVHLKQTRQVLCSTSRKAPPRTTVVSDQPNPPVIPVLPPNMSNKLHIHVEHVSKLYTNDTGRFPI